MGDTMTELEQPDDAGQTVTGPTPVDSSTAPVDVMTALGFDATTVQAIVITPTSVVAVAADYPDPPGATPPDDTPTDPEEGVTDAAD
jgi:hypothetical protein